MLRSKLSAMALKRAVGILKVFFQRRLEQGQVCLFIPPVRDTRRLVLL